MGFALLGHDEPRSHLDPGRAHHQKMGHQPPGGDAAGDEYGDAVDLEEDLLDQNRQGHRPDVSPGFGPLQDQRIRPPVDEHVRQGGGGSKTDDPGAAAFGFGDVIFLGDPPGKDHHFTAEFADQVEVSLVSRGEGDQVDPEGRVRQAVGLLDLA